MWRVRGTNAPIAMRKKLKAVISTFIMPLHILMQEHSALESISHSDIPNVKTQYYETIH